MRRLDPLSLSDHVDSMYRAAWALCGVREDAEDLVQDTFVRVLARPRVIHGDERGYLLQALRHSFYSRRRSEARRPRTVMTLDDFEPADHRSVAPEQMAETGEVLDAIGELPEDLRLTIIAVDVVGLSYAEAARAVGVSETTITARLYRARQRIASRFNGSEDRRTQAQRSAPPRRLERDAT